MKKYFQVAKRVIVKSREFIELFLIPATEIFVLDNSRHYKVIDNNSNPKLDSYIRSQLKNDLSIPVKR
jgi:hypothetical protein